MWGHILKDLAKEAIKIGMEYHNQQTLKKSVKDKNVIATIHCTYRRSDLFPIKQIIAFTECVIVITNNEIIYHRIEGANTGGTKSLPITVSYNVEEKSSLGKHFYLMTILHDSVTFEFRFNKEQFNEFDKAINAARRV